MKKRSLLLSFVLGIVCLTACWGNVFSNPEKQNVSAATSTIDSFYMYDADVANIAPIEAGKKLPGSPIPGNTSGYSNTIPLGAKNVTLTASSNDGYVLKGWLVGGATDTYYAIKDQVVNVLEDGTTCYTADLDPTAKVVYQINPYRSGYNERVADFVVCEVSEEIEVEPVFDFKEYTVTVKYKGGEVISTSAGLITGETFELTDQELTNFVQASSFGGAASLKKVEGYDGVDLAANQYKFKVENGRTTEFSLRYIVSGFKDITLELNFVQLYVILKHCHHTNDI